MISGSYGLPCSTTDATTMYGNVIVHCHDLDRMTQIRMYGAIIATITTKVSEEFLVHELTCCLFYCR